MRVKIKGEIIDVPKEMQEQVRKNKEYNAHFCLGVSCEECSFSQKWEVCWRVTENFEILEDKNMEGFKVNNQEEAFELFQKIKGKRVVNDNLYGTVAKLELLKNGCWDFILEDTNSSCCRWTFNAGDWSLDYLVKVEANGKTVYISRESAEGLGLCDE